MKLRELVNVLNLDTNLRVVVHDFEESDRLAVVFEGFEENLFNRVNPEIYDLLRNNGEMNVQNISARKDHNGFVELLVLVGDEENYHAL